MRCVCCTKASGEVVKILDEAGLNGESVAHDAIAHGVLTMDDEGDVGFGMPSFRTHMVRRLESIARKQRDSSRESNS